jgi:phospholipase C
MSRITTQRPTSITMLVALMLSAWVIAGASGARSASAALTGIHKIQHVVMVMQENHSFDNYFGTFPGADGIPMSNGVPTACLPSLAGG